MNCIEKLVNEIYSNSHIPFQLNIETMGEYSSLQFDIFKEYITKEVKYKNFNYTLKINNEFALAAQLLELYINSKLNEYFIEKGKITLALLEEIPVDEEIILNVWPELTREFNLINILIDNNYDEVIAYIKTIYSNTNIQIIKYKKYILIIGKFQNCEQHVSNIFEIINNEFSQKCYISYCSVKNYTMIKKMFNRNVYKIDIALKYDLEENIFDEKKLLLEGVMDSIPNNIKDDFLNNFNDSILKMDNEMVRTIEIFFNCGLNLSEAAKELYIHRNTLIYRLDKIEKITGYDIREFNNAMIFKIALFYLGGKNNLMVENI